MDGLTTTRKPKISNQIVIEMIKKKDEIKYIKILLVDSRDLN